MKVFRLSQTELDSMVQGWSQNRRVYRPAAGRQQSAQADCAPGWERVAGSSPLTVATGPSKTSVKTFLFPQPETMQTYTLKSSDPDKGLLKEPEKTTGKQIIVGLRPCDARSVKLNNLPFREDPFYQASLARTVMVGFTCNTMCATCFCDQMGGSPMGTEGLDIAISQVDGTMIAEVLTPAGEELIADLSLTPAEDSDINALAERRKDCPQADSAKLDALKSRDLNKLYGAPVWQALGESCINCGACTFNCPTCYCFDVQDEVVRGQGRRIRYWDSCMFPLYSLHTTGHNPRGQKMQRTRNRFMHKLKYFPDRYGPFSCVGCGRCVQDCPVNIDIREVIHDLLAVE
ncbi:MAG: 4Fe-4S dicluster domain-containing protein [Proteobacteria bacterium]|nr:4Fe-4S dicluster domain-containing protein [Pseudomonadota bacterium]MBU4296540.1 4Fe-4S dicluster domain-containing protein [Pseudomonadota bacterium]MCG2748558.1 4Fe-4S dicluster domain-containing protein [Desulfobulbaceae bacterium]